ncbi:serine/threonine-protein kinase [Methylobacterium sp. J-090]|uniref:serine/threonine-protein kinase n=1 Tax=Methylobacterium sp. J-090 TaxID=2836666 RepID=UPI001FBB94F1|nr:serine/threonine-protein kinase [Methylobacterium sp. J-090]MCJ2081702.1 protein kinase [Methylobacterium sp. J-090]
MTGPTVFDPRPHIPAGTRLNELYEIESLIAVGGMGEIYRGHAIETGDVVAIKTIRPDLAGSGPALALFRKEASALHNLHHEAIIRYYVFSIDRVLNLPYLAMEFVEGIALAELFRRGPLPYEALDILRRRLASGLEVAHRAGIVHRDVTPDNVILPAGDPGRAKIIDFGIARSSLGGQTVIGDGFAGKYSHVSPEQLGLQGGAVTARSDIYSLGLVLAEASLGRGIDMGTSPADVIVRRASVPDLSGVDPRLRPLLEAMLDPDPARRPASMAEVAAWSPPPADPPRVAAPPPKAVERLPLRRRPLAFAAGLVACVLAAGGLAFLGFGSDPGGPVFAPDVILDERPVPRPDPPPDPPRKQAETPLETRPAEPSVPPPTPPAPEPPKPPTAPPRADKPDSPPDTLRPAPPNPETKPAPKPAPSMEQVAAYIRGYRGGSCFYLNPLTVSAREAVIEAYGAARAPFAAFDTAFTADLGFEPRIQLRQIDAPQCPAVDVLAHPAVLTRAHAPKLTLERDVMRSGEELRGAIELGEDADVTLLLLDGEGGAHNLAAHLTRKGRKASFAVRLETPAAAAVRGQLLVAVSSPAALPFLAERRGLRTEAVFRQLADEATRPGSPVGLAVRYVKVGG